MHRECRKCFLLRRLQSKPLVSHPRMYHGTCVTHVPWCLSGSLNHSGGENVPDIPGACATRNLTHLARGPCPPFLCDIIVARLSNVGILENKSTLLTISRLWRYCGPSNYRFNFLLYWYAPWVFFEVANVLSCSPFMFENTANKQLDWRIRHSHLVSTLFHSLVRWWRPRRIRPQITRLSQLENSAMGTWPIYKNSIIPDWFERWRDIKFWYRC